MNSPMNAIFNLNSFSKCVAVALGIAGATTAFATPTIYLEVGSAYGSNQKNPYQNGDAGEFTALSSTLGVPSGYAAGATFTIPAGGYDAGVTGFETFCIEDNTYFWVNTTYDYAVTSNVWIPAGGAVAGNNGVPFTTTPLSAGSAWLYEQFATEDLAGYNYSNTADRLADAGLLQQAIWEIQGSPAEGSSPPAVDYSNPYVELVLAHFTTLANARLAAGNTYGVSVLDLYSTDSNGNINGVYQDQLVYQGVPDNGSTIALLGVALLGLVAVGRRFGKPARA
jgi:hypothetical protein